MCICYTSLYVRPPIFNVVYQYFSEKKKHRHTSVASRTRRSSALVDFSSYFDLDHRGAIGCLVLFTAEAFIPAEVSKREQDRTHCVRTPFVPLIASRQHLPSLLVVVIQGQVRMLIHPPVDRNSRACFFFFSISILLIVGLVACVFSPRIYRVSCPGD